MLNKLLSIDYPHIQEWKQLLLQGQADAIAEQTSLFLWAESQSAELAPTGPKTVTVVLKNTGDDNRGATT